MDKILDLEDYMCFLIPPLALILFISAFGNDKISIGSHHLPLVERHIGFLTGLAKNVYLLILNLILVCMFDISLDRMKKKSNGTLTRRIILGKFIQSPFIITFIIIVLYWCFIPKCYYNNYLLLIMVILYSCAGYRFLKKIEKKYILSHQEL